MPLHLDYRPNDFSEIVGNETIVKSIKTILERPKDYPKAWLFIGPTGCGKTTFTRIVARKLGCPPSTTNQDFQEINASNNRGIDTAREIMRSMVYMPVNASNSCRIYVLDEVHQGTKDFQNSLLKALEDTPAHVYFLLCTTDPQKLLKTIRNRCSTFEVKRLRDGQLGKLIEHVLSEEGEGGVEEDVIKAIAEAADGCPRQALVTLEQTIDLCRALLNGSWADVAPIIKDLNDEPEKVRQAVNGYMQSVLLKQTKVTGEVASQALLVLDCFSDPLFYNGKPGLTKACADVFV